MADSSGFQALLDAVRQKAFYDVGGTEPGQNTSEKLNTAFGHLGNVGKTISDSVDNYLKIKKASLENNLTSTYGAKEKEADINLKKAQADYYGINKGKLPDLWIHPITRQVSDVAQPGYIHVPASTAATIAATPAKEQAQEGAKIREEERKPPTEGQSIFSIYASRMGDANKIIGDLTPYAKTANPLTFQAQKTAPDVLNPLKSNEFQSYDQATRNFLNAVLRKESGAVISPTEFVEGRRQYFPMPGDSDQVIAQKAQNRQTAIENFTRGAGKAFVKNAPTNQKVETRSIFMDAQGNKAYQNYDGSFEEIK